MTSSALDAAAFALLQALASAESRPGARARQAVDDAIRKLRALTAARIRLLVVRHGLAELSEDAEQACLIALVDAVHSWEPGRSSFSTLLGWRLRGVLAGLRRQWRGDNRTGAGRLRAATLSLDSDTGSQLPSDWLADPAAEADVVRGAADWLALRYASRIAADCSEAVRADWLNHLADDGERAAPPPTQLRRRH